ncbi:MAG TPA: phenylalanine--tRNA ligase subunit beta [Candidatus Diapherotrites archaeon]|uniref:phenylalanine--tRNA ligase n=2 Tax=Candidatus Iainarchaeum sp. TaxID=3101447 RepID=A0A7J4KV11_9ARCH|nr:phenylalanine--tRNA ligase subunit beta [Candidatus Diapherotrites archaeon]
MKMVMVDFELSDFEKLAGRKFSKEQMEDAVLYAKSELDKFEDGKASVEIADTNRPDLWSVEGIARAIRPFYDKGKTPSAPKMKNSGLQVKIEKSVKEARPFTVCGVVKGISVNEGLLVSLIQMQEKISNTFGRKRKEAAIGIYDFDKIEGNIRYYGAEPRKVKFVPLDFENELDLDEILELHPKGIEFAHLLKGKKHYPIFEDSKGHVLSMPPIINSNYSGKVEPGKRNLFVEVSGFNLEIIGTALNVLMLAFADRGGRLETVKVIDSNGKSFTTPGFKREKISLSIEYLNKVSGMQFTPKQALQLLEKMHYKGKIQGKKLLLETPFFRTDILHPIDIVEDALIAFGYNRIGPEIPKVFTQGSELAETRKIDKVRDACVGLGLQEALTFTLTSKEKQEGRMLLKSEEFAEIENFASLNYQIFRKRLLPELLEFLAKNKSVELPHAIFEIGKTVELHASSETGVLEKQKLCIALSNSQGLNFNSAKSLLQSLSKMLSFSFKLQEAESAFLIAGRSAEVLAHGKSIGFLGELHPQVLQNFGIENPVCVLELEV